MYKDQYLDGELIDDCADYYDDSFSYEKSLQENYDSNFIELKSDVVKSLFLGSFSLYSTYKLSKKHPFVSGIVLCASIIKIPSLVLKANYSYKNLKNIDKQLKKVNLN